MPHTLGILSAEDGMAGNVKQRARGGIMSKHSKAVWLKAAKEIRDRYTKEAFAKEEIRGGYCSEPQCSFCLLTLSPDSARSSECSECIYFLSLREGFRKNTRHVEESRYCCMFEPEVPDPYVTYATVARRRTWYDRHFSPWIKSLPANHPFFRKPKGKK